VKAHKFKIIYIFLVSGLLFLSCQHSDAAAEKGLELSISLDKSEYKKNEPININFKLENKTKKPIYANKRFYINSEESAAGQREIYLSVTSPSGEKLPCKISYETGMPKSDYFALLNPGEEVSAEYNRNIAYYFDFTQPGTYAITAVYQNIYGGEIGIDAFKEKIISKPLKIKIVE